MCVLSLQCLLYTNWWAAFTRKNCWKRNDEKQNKWEKKKNKARNSRKSREEDTMKMMTTTKKTVNMTTMFLQALPLPEKTLISSYWYSRDLDQQNCVPLISLWKEEEEEDLYFWFSGLLLGSLGSTNFLSVMGMGSSSLYPKLTPSMKVGKESSFNSVVLWSRFLSLLQLERSLLLMLFFPLVRRWQNGTHRKMRRVFFFYSHLW